MADPYGTGNYALEEYQMQLMLLEHQRKKQQMRARQEDSTSLERNNRPLLDPQVSPSFEPNRQSDLHHGLLTPGTTPPNPPLTRPLSRTSLPAEHPAPPLDPRYEGKRYNGPSYYPPPLPPQHTFQYTISTYTPPSNYSNEYQEYPQNRQIGQYSTPNFLEWVNSFSTPNSLPEAQTPFASMFDTGCSSPTYFPGAQIPLPPIFDTNCSPSNQSEISIGSMISSDSTESGQSVQTPVERWDEPPDLSMASTDSDQPLEFRAAESLNVMDQVFRGCFGTSISPSNKDLNASVSDTSTSNLHSLPSQTLTVSNLGMNTRFCPLEQAESLPKMDLRPQFSSSVLEEYEQSAIQPRNITNGSGTECREYEISVSQDGDTLSKPNCDTDIRISVEARPSPCATRSVRNTTSEREFPYYRRQTSSPSPMTSSESETCPWYSDNDTDWGDDEPDDDHRTTVTPIIIEGSNILAEQELPNLVTKPVLSKMKQELVDRLMAEFWQIFNQEQEINRYEDTLSQSTRLHQCQEPETRPQDEQNTKSTSKSGTKSDIQINGTRPIGGQNGKRKRQGQDDDENDESEDRNPKRPKGLLSPPRNQGDTSKFACPYRKHDPRTYCVRHWRSCALTPLETVARVKGHLYRHHRIFPCQRCKTLFNDQQEVNDHLKEPKGCELLEAVQQDGITNEIVEKLRSKKKAHRDQSEEDRWKEIYQILFPGEMVLSPFFEEIQEDVIQSPDSRELADYEEYCRRELPRVFRTSLEEVVNNNTQPLEEQLRSQLMDLIRDAQDRVFSSYRSSSSTAIGTPPRSAPNPNSQATSSFSLSERLPTSPLKSQPTRASPGGRSRPRLPAFFQPPSPQNHLESGLDLSDRNITPSKPDRNDRSDSGYDSSSFILPLPVTPGDSSVNTSTSSSQTWPLLEMNQQTNGSADNEVPATQPRLDPTTGPITSSGNGDLSSEHYLPQNSFDFDLDSVILSNFDMGEFGNCDFPRDLDGFF